MRTFALWAGRIVPLTVLLFWILVLRPVGLGGGTSYVIVTGGSMEPTLHAGDLVLGQRQAAYGLGDIVVYRVPESAGFGNRQVVHRITAGNAIEGFRLQGDATAHADPWPVPVDHIVGKVDTVIPFGGRVALFLRNPLFLASMAAGLAFVIVVLPAPGRRTVREHADDEPAGTGGIRAPA